MIHNVTETIVADLMLGEVPFWDAGICRVQTDEYNNIEVRGEHGDRVGYVICDIWIEKPEGDSWGVLDLEAIAAKVNRAIEREYRRL